MNWGAITASNVEGRGLNKFPWHSQKAQKEKMNENHQVDRSLLGQNFQFVFNQNKYNKRRLPLG